MTFRQSASDANNNTIANIVSVYAQDQLWLTPRLQATLGVRVERFALDYRDHRTAARLARTDDLFSPRAGLVFKPSAPLSLHARAKRMTGAQFRKLDVLRLPAMRMSIHLLPAKTAHLAFRATPAPPADRKKRMKHFKFTEKRYEQLREQILKAAGEPLTLPDCARRWAPRPRSSRASPRR